MADFDMFNRKPCVSTKDPKYADLTDKEKAARWRLDELKQKAKTQGIALSLDGKPLTYSELCDALIDRKSEKEAEKAEKAESDLSHADLFYKKKACVSPTSEEYRDLSEKQKEGRWRKVDLQEEARRLKSRNQFDEMEKTDISKAKYDELCDALRQHQVSNPPSASPSRATKSKMQSYSPHWSKKNTEEVYHIGSTEKGKIVDCETTTGPFARKKISKEKCIGLSRGAETEVPVIYFTHIAGDLDKLKGIVEQSKPYLSWTDATKPSECPTITINKERPAFVVFGGDAVGNGKRNVTVVRTLLKLKKQYPKQVTLILGEQDIDKMRISSEVESLAAFPDIPLPYWGCPSLDEDQCQTFNQYKTMLTRTGEENVNDPIHSWAFLFGENKELLSSYFREFKEIYGLSEYPENHKAVLDYLAKFYSPKGEFAEYLEYSDLAHVHGNNLFCHGFVNDDNFGYVPDGFGNLWLDYRAPSMTPVDWVEALNQWKDSQVADWKKNPKWKKGREWQELPGLKQDRTLLTPDGFKIGDDYYAKANRTGRKLNWKARGGNRLMAYARQNKTKANDTEEAMYSIVLATGPSGEGKSLLEGGTLEEKSVKYLKRSGIGRMVVGHYFDESGIPRAPVVVQKPKIQMINGQSSDNYTIFIFPERTQINGTWNPEHKSYPFTQLDMNPKSQNRWSLAAERANYVPSE